MRLVPLRASTLKYLAVAVIVALFPMVSQAADKPLVRWISSPWAPNWITEGPQKGNGYGDRMQKLIQDALPGFAHETAWTNAPRLMRNLLSDEAACFATGFYRIVDPETGKLHEKLVWSAPIYLFYWHGLIMLRETRDRLPAGDGLSLAGVLRDSSLTLGLDRGRDYGADLNPIIEQYRNADHVLEVGQEKNLKAHQYRLLLRGRIDYVIDYSYMLGFAERQLGAPGRFTFVPLKDHREPHGLGAILCNNSPQGRAVIAALNKQLVTLRHSEAFRSINTDWFMPEGRETEFWRLWEEELLSREE